MNANKLAQGSFIPLWLAIFGLALAPRVGRSQSAFWINSPGGEWNTPEFWDVGVVPGPGTNANIAAGYLVTYDQPMVAPNFAPLTLSGSLFVDTNLFVVDGGATNNLQDTIAAGGILAINPNGVMTVANLTNSTALAGSLAITNGVYTATNSGPLALAVGATMFMQGGTLSMTNTVGANAINVGPNARNNGAQVTLNAANVTLDKLLVIAGGASSGTTASTVTVNGGTLNAFGGTRVLNSQDDTAARIIVDNGALVNLGAFISQRSSPSGGLLLSNGVATASSIQIGTAASRAYSTIYGGVLTNTGSFTISDTTSAATSSDRRSQFLVRGGTVVSTGPGGIIVANQSNNGGSVSGSQIGGVLDVGSGSLTAEGITLVRDTTLTNAFARLNLTGGAIYLGSLGLVANVGFSNTAFAITWSGGTLGAKSDWSSSVPLPISGGVTFRAADVSGAPHNVTLSGRLSGSGTFTKSGSGVLTLSATNTYTAPTVVSEGTLALASTGSVSNTTQITVASGALLDVSAVPGASLVNNQKLIGSGSVQGALAAQAGTSIQPAGNGAAGTITFLTGLNELGGVVNNFDLSDDPTGVIKTNDFINISGDLTLSGTNTIQIATLGGPLPTPSTYNLLHYTGNLNGGLTNLALAGATGILSNNATSKTISLVVQTAVRAATNVVWVGNTVNNTWDTVVTTNWLNGGVLDYFVTGDNARFDATGAAHPAVNVGGSVSPASTTVDAVANFSFSGNGSIDAGSLAKTNSGTLSMLLTNNNYPGPTTIGGGTLEAAKLANGGAPSSLGTAGTDPTNLTLYAATLRYLGPNASSDRGITLNDPASTIEVTSAGSTLTVGGNLPGPGGLTKTGPGNVILSGANSYLGMTTISNGNLQINNAATALGTNTVNLAGGTLVLNVSGQPTFANALNILTPSGLTSAGGNNNILTGPWSGPGLLNLSIASGTFSINADMGTNFTGTILVTSNSTGAFRFNAGGGNPAIGSDFATFDLGASSTALINRNGANVVYHLGALAGGTNTQLRGSENTGSASTYVVGANNQSTTFAGSIRTGNGGTTAAVNILKAGTGTWTLSGSNTYNGTTIITNGVLALSGSGSIDNTSSILVSSNTALDVFSRVDGTLTLTGSQVLKGQGTIRGCLTVGPGTSVAPGDTDGAIGQLTVTNALVLQTNSTVTLDVDYDLAMGSGTNDQIVGISSVTYGGTLSLNIITLEPTSALKLFQASVYQGAFDAISPPTPPIPNMVWDTSSLAVDGTLRLTRPRPGIGSFSNSGGQLILSGTNGNPFATYYVLESTNLALPRSQWTPIATDVFQFDGTFSFTNAVSSGTQQLYFQIQVP